MNNSGIAEVMGIHEGRVNRRNPGHSPSRVLDLPRLRLSGNNPPDGPRAAEKPESEIESLTLTQRILLLLIAAKSN